MHVINNWLKGKRNFIVGRAIYKVVGTNQQFKELLKKGPTSFNTEKLLKELQQLANQNIAELPNTQVLNAEVVEMPNSSNEVLAAIKKEWMPLYQQMNYKRHQLDQWGTDNSPHIKALRKQLVEEIDQLEKQCNQIWQKRNYYIEHNELPNTITKQFYKPTDPLELAQLINTIKRNIRRNRQYVTQHTTKPSYVAKYNHYKNYYQFLTNQEYKEVEN